MMLARSLATLLLLSASLAPAQKFIPKHILFHGAPDYTDQELMEAAGLKMGVAINYAEMNQHSQKLMDTKLFEGLAFKFDGWDLVFTLTPSTDVVPARFLNLPTAMADDLDAFLRRRFPLYHGRVSSQEGINEQVRLAMEEFLAGKGIPAKVLSTTVADHKLNRNVAVDYAIASPPILVGEVGFAGVADEDRAPVQALLAKLNGQPFASDSSVSQMETWVGNYYRGKGYASVELHAAPAPTMRIAPEAVRIGFTLKVDRGMVYKLGAVRLDAGLLLSQDEFDKAAKIEPGALATLRVLAPGRQALEHCYRQKGYPEVAVEFEPAFDRAAAVVSYAVHVHPGEQYKFSTLKIEGLPDEQRRALLRQWQLAPDDPLDTDYIARFVPSASRDNPSLAQLLTTYRMKIETVEDPETHTGAVAFRFQPLSAQ